MAQAAEFGALEETAYSGEDYQSTAIEEDGLEAISVEEGLNAAFGEGATGGFPGEESPGTLVEEDGDLAFVNEEDPGGLLEEEAVESVSALGGLIGFRKQRA